MKVGVEVKNKKEAEAVKLAWDDPSIRAFVIIMGTLSHVPSQRAKERVITFLKDKFDEMENSV